MRLEGRVALITTKGFRDLLEIGRQIRPHMYDLYADFPGVTAWQKTGLDRHYGWACAADPAQPEVCYVSVSPGARRAHSENGAQAAIFRWTGEGWRRLAGGLPQPLEFMPYALLTDPEAPGHVYAGLSDGEVWHSADYGEGWRRLPFALGAIHRDLVAL